MQQAVIVRHPKQITLFGASGFLGRHIVRRLTKTGARLCIPTRDLEKASILKPMGDPGQIVPLSCSLRSESSVAAAIGNSDAVINLVGILYEKGRNTFQSLHVEAAARIARCAKEQGVSYYVHVSALGADVGSPSAYARSKAAGEQAVSTFFSHATIIRPSIVFGAEDHFFNMFATLARYSPVLPLIGGGHTRFQPIYVGDVADAVVHALFKPEAQGRIFELGGPQIYTFRDLLELMLKVTEQRRIFVDLPWWLAKFEAFFLERMSHPLLTRDQIDLLKTDNIIGPNSHPTLRNLDIVPTALEAILPTYLGRFRSAAVQKEV